MKSLTLSDFKFLIQGLFKNKTTVLDNLSISPESKLLFNGEVIEGGSEINDVAKSNTSTYSSNKIETLLSGLAKSEKHQEYSYINQTIAMLGEAVNISSLMTDNVIVNQQVLVKNNIDAPLQFAVYENGILVLDVTLKGFEIQKYELPITPNISIMCQGTFDLILYINYE